MPHVDPESGILSFEGVPDLHALTDAVRMAFQGGLARVEAHLPMTPETVDVRHVFYRAGFRREGVRRGEDIGVFSLLVTDTGDAQTTFTAVMNSVTPRKRLIAHALVQDEAGRVLLCETSFKPDWELPGGIVEPGESPRDAAEREMVEEMGWSPALTGILVVDWLRPYRGWEDALELVFATRRVTVEQAARLVPDGREIVALHWVTAEELPHRMTSFGAARVLSALAACRTGVTRYTEGGHTPPGLAPDVPDLP